MGGWIRYDIRTSNIDEVMSSYGEPFEEKFISELEGLISLPVFYQKKGNFLEKKVWNEEKQIWLQKKRYEENYSMTLLKRLKDPVWFSLDKEYKYFTIGQSFGGEPLPKDKDKRLNYYLLASTVFYLTRKILSLGGQQIILYDMGDITEVAVQTESDIDTFFNIVDREITQYLKVPYSEAKKMPGFPPYWK